MIEQRWYQKEAVDSIFNFFDTHGRNEDGTYAPANPVVVMPTGTGKSIVIAEFVRRLLWQFRTPRVIVAAHVKNLLDQNSKKLDLVWPGAPYGIHSDGLGRRDHMQPVIFGGIASMYRNPELFGFRDVLFVDEAHLINPKDNTMYADFIAGLQHINPWLRIIGTTATHYRQGMGLITDPGGLFTDVCYNIATIEGFARLIAEGYLAPIFPRPTVTKLDVSGVKVSGGDFVESQLQAAVDKPAITNAALTEALQWGGDRRRWICFASGIEHSEHIAEWLNAHGISAVAIHAKNAKKKWHNGGDYNDEAFKAHQRGEIRCLVGNNMFTTGYDDPYIDFIIMLRPTKSTSLWVQMLGRGTRPAPGKYYCLCLDFANNAPTLGPINDPVLPRKKGQAGGDAPIKICEACGNYNHASARYCIACGAEFHFKPHIQKTANDAPLLKGGPEAPIIKEFEVERVFYSKHHKVGSPWPTLKIQYQLRGRTKPHNEFISIENDKAGAQYHAREWFFERYAGDPPKTVDEALQIQSQLRIPYRVKIHTNADFPRIVSCEYVE